MKPTKIKTASNLPDTPYSILLADGHAVVRMGLKTLISGFDKYARLQEVAAGRDVIAELKSRPFDLLILDINMRQMESFSLIAYIRRAFPSLRILIFTMNDELLFAKRFLRRGVRGYLHKQTEESEILAAYEAIRNGRIYISDSLTRRITGRIMDKEELTPFDRLTDRELEVILQILGGNSPEEISKILHLNKSTIGTHKFRIYKKLNVQGTVELMELARNSGLLGGIGVTGA
jgi:two-component system invasion response regulator UvrY